MAQMAAQDKAKVDNVCPECGHQFRGNGFDGIDAHWRAKHEHVMTHGEARPLITTGACKGRRNSTQEAKESLLAPIA